jgi:hypothetical protein
LDLRISPGGPISLDERVEAEWNVINPDIGTNLVFDLSIKGAGGSSVLLERDFPNHMVSFKLSDYISNEDLDDFREFQFEVYAHTTDHVLTGRVQSEAIRAK